MARPAAVTEHLLDQRVVARLDPLLELVGLRLCDPARVECRVDPLQQRLLQCVVQPLGWTPSWEAASSITALLSCSGSTRLVADGGAAARDRECRRADCYDLPFHGAPSG